MSKSFIPILLLAVLSSACNRPINVTTLPAGDQFAQPMASPTIAPMFDTINPTVTETPLIVTATLVLTCAAPTPRVKIGDKVLVMVEDWDKLKLRSTAEVSPNNVVKELDQYSQLKILEGPVCASSTETGSSYWFWKVVAITSNEVGWVTEGDSSRYFIVTTARTPIPAPDSACAAPAPRVATGDNVTVLVENWDKLKLRSTAEVSPNNVVKELDQYSHLKILDGPVCVASTETGYTYWFWQVVVMPSNEVGWVAEGDTTHYFVQKY